MDNKKVNIGGNSNDIFHRYKRDIVCITHTRKKGVQTVVRNLDIIAQQLHVKVSDLQKVIRKKTNTSVTKNIINGCYTVEQIETVINDFVKKYVLCKKCLLPELKNNVCSSCGFDGIKIKEPDTIKEKESTIILDECPKGKEEPNKVETKVVEYINQLYELKDKAGANEMIDLCWRIATTEDLTTYSEQIEKFIETKK
jgi:translation initiation factor 2 beta subunit (eIF-2beta)/eIF-5